jgi:hypothetical protein
MAPRSRLDLVRIVKSESIGPRQALIPPAEALTIRDNRRSLTWLIWKLPQIPLHQHLSPPR